MVAWYSPSRALAHETASRKCGVWAERSSVSAPDLSMTLEPPETGSQQLGGSGIDVAGVSVRYAGSARGSVGARLAVADTSFSVRPGEFLAILGPSGCGKSTLLKVMAGLLEPSRGTVRIGSGKNEDARVGFVFQSDALLPWRTAVQNVQLAVELGGGNRAEAAGRAVRLMQDLGLGDSCDRYPAQLSGGMRKRVALARALAYQPTVFMMDEPLSALDAQTRIHVGNFFLSILARFGQTVVFVTHDLDEAVALADRILIMTSAPGRISAFVDVPLPKPRGYYESRFADGFKDIQKRVWELLES
jgi:NitT/TauT family transport system ATP-binding protein